MIAIYSVTQPIGCIHILYNGYVCIISYYTHTHTHIHIHQFTLLIIRLTYAVQPHCPTYNPTAPPTTQLPKRQYILEVSTFKYLIYV